MIVKLPDAYPFGEYVRIGPRIYRVLLRVGKIHLLSRFTV